MEVEKIEGCVLHALSDDTIPHAPSFKRCGQQITISGRC